MMYIKNDGWKKMIFLFKMVYLSENLKGVFFNVVFLSRKHTIFEVKILPSLGCVGPTGSTV